MATISLSCEDKQRKSDPLNTNSDILNGQNISGASFSTEKSKRFKFIYITVNLAQSFCGTKTSTVPTPWYDTLFRVDV